jgi:hypothetical protein
LDRLVLDLKTEVSDPDVNELNYQYLVSGGKIIGGGSTVIWELTGVDPGFYSAKVKLRDGNGAAASASLSISVVTPIHCPLPCATVNISCPDEVFKGEPMICEATLFGGEPTVSPVYEWTVSAGAIIKGQGTSSIEVATAGVADQRLMASLKVGGYPPECPKVSTRQVQVRKKN